MKKSRAASEWKSHSTWTFGSGPCVSTWTIDFATATRVLGEATATFWRPLTKHAFFVAPDTTQKRKDYDVSIVRTVVFPASETEIQITGPSRLIRDIAGVTRTDLDTESRTLTLRANPQSDGRGDGPDRRSRKAGRRTGA